MPIPRLDGPSAEVYENVAKSAELTGNYQLALSHRMNRLKVRIQMYFNRLYIMQSFSSWKASAKLKKG